MKEISGMKAYVGCKIIVAKKVEFQDYQKAKFGKTFENPVYKPTDKVYLVVYPPIGLNAKAYISMSPVEVFEQCYRPIHAAEKTMTILD